MKNLARISLALVLCLAGAGFLRAQTVIKSDWPTDKIPSDIPSYPYAGVTDHGPSSSDYWIKVADGKSVNIARYVALLKANGWVDDSHGMFEKLKKGDESIEIRVFPHENLSMFIVSVFKPPHSWPTKDFPELPEPGKGMYTFNTDPDSGTTIDIGRITQEDLVEYFKLLVSRGWTGNPEELQLSRTSPRPLTIIAAGNGENEWTLSLSQE